MSFCNGVWYCCIMNFRKWKQSPRNYVVLIIVFLMVYMQLADLQSYENSNNGILSAWILPYFFSPTILLAVTLSFVVVFSNAPFYDKQTPYVIIRTGRLSWFWGTILYIIFVSLLLSLYIALIPLILGMGTADYSNQINSAYVSTLSFATPIVAELVSVFILWLANMWLAFVIMFFNVMVSESLGITMGIIFCLISYLFSIFPPFRYCGYFSPMSWINITVIDWSTNSQYFPPFRYIILFFAMSYLILIALTWSKFRYCEFRAIKRGAV